MQALSALYSNYLSFYGICSRSFFPYKNCSAGYGAAADTPIVMNAGKIHADGI